MIRPSPSDPIALLVLSCVVASVYLGYYCLWNYRAGSMLKKWAAKNEFQLLESTRRDCYKPGWFRWWLHNNFQVQFRVHVRDKNGAERLGWIRFGSNFRGVLFSNHTEVQWDKQ